MNRDHNLRICKFPLNFLSIYILIHIAEFYGLSFLNLSLLVTSLPSTIIPEAILYMFFKSIIDFV